MTKRHHHENVRPLKLPCLTFTVDQLALLAKTLGMLEQVLHLHHAPLPNAEFALATTARVRAKIERVIQLRCWEEAVAMDFNETIMLQTSVWIYLTSLDTRTPSLENARERKQCQALISLLLSISGQACTP